MGDPPLKPAAERDSARRSRAPLTFRRLSGLDRSGPPPQETLAGAPLRPWTIPNAIGYLRGLLIPIFLVTALGDDDGRDTVAAILFAVIAWSDYFDGIAARITGQYSRLGVLLDPLLDRMLIVSGVVVCWHFELLPRWVLAVLLVREVGMIALTRYALARGVEIKINWFGRWGVWPVMSAPFFAIADARPAALVCLYAGLALALVASVVYVRDARRELTLDQK